ncbi:MAG: McrC family protein [Psychrosphaera sp.]|nr:McrC family protein [Psychrosphaera sp.]
MRIEVGIERADIDIDLTEIIKADGELNILPQVKNYFNINYKPSSNTLCLATKGFIGLIPITKHLAIDIRPKFSIRNLAKLVSIAQGKFRPTSFFSKYYNENQDFCGSVSDFLLNSFVIELEKLHTEGIYRQYIATRAVQSQIKGRLNITDSINKQWAHGKFNKASVDFYELSPQTPLNRLIKYTIAYCLNEFPKTANVDNATRQKLEFFYQGLSRVDIGLTEHLLDQAFELIKTDKIPQLRHYYITICEICRLLITSTGVDLDHHGSQLNINSFTINMEKTFEQFLLNSIRNHRVLFDDSTIVLDGNFEGKKRFFSPPGRGMGYAKPDIVIKTGNQTKHIIAAKYNLKTTDSDRYQIIAHALSYQAKKAVLVLPATTKNTEIVAIGTVGGRFEIEIYELFIDLSAEDLEAEEHKYLTIISKLMEDE